MLKKLVLHTLISEQQ